MKSRGPPILPMYKSNMQKKKTGGLMSICIAIMLPICALFLLVFFFLSIYMGSMYLQEHIEGESALMSSIGLPNTHNIIQKWSLAHLHGVDLTKLGPPPNAIPQGLGSQFRSHHKYFSNHSSEALQGLTHRIGDSINHIYYNSSASAYEKVHASSVRLRGWLNSIHDLNLNSTAYTNLDSQKIKDYIYDKSGAALKGINDLGRQGVKGVSELGQRGVQSMRGSVTRPLSSPFLPPSSLNSADSASSPSVGSQG